MTFMAKSKSYLACVTGQKSSERIIRVAGSIAAEGEDAAVLSVLSHNPTESEIEAIEFLHGIAREEGLSMTVLNNNNPVLAVVDFIRHKKVTHVITGIPNPPHGGFTDIVRSVLPKVRIITIPEVSTEEDDIPIGKPFLGSRAALLPVSVM